MTASEQMEAKIDIFFATAEGLPNCSMRDIYRRGYKLGYSMGFCDGITSERENKEKGDIEA